MSSTRIDREREHDHKIKDNAEDVWGWSSPGGKLRAERRANYFLSLSGMNPQSKVLEIGCGTGLFTEKVSKSGAHITATDLSEDLLAVARKKNIPNCLVEEADAHHLKYADASFDIVFGSSILHHLDMDIALKEVWRVLKPGGKMVFAEPNMLNPQILVQKNVPFIKKWLGDSPDETAIIRWKLTSQLKKLGFKNCNIFPYDFLHPYTPSPLIGLVKGIGAIVEKTPLLREIAGSVIIYAEK
jgi:2-polyprenyl-3-methyl-5-hydroxy-6-metoxy-1,4-benzoquinol methylase